MAYPTYQSLIGNTPLIDLSGLINPARDGVQVLAKCEFLNPGYSIKDRIVAYIFDQAEASGRLKPGGRVVSASSGNTGAAVAMIAAMRGYKAVICTSPKCSKEKMDAIRAYGAQLHVVDEREQGYNYMQAAQKLVEQDGDMFDVDQYASPHNAEAHYRTLGPEIWRETQGRVTHFTCGSSTGGTISGVGRYLKEQNPDIDIVLADPFGSVFYDYFTKGDHGCAGRFHVEGVGKGSIPGAMDFQVVDRVVRVSDEQAFAMCRDLAESQGILAGGSSGLNVVSALGLAAEVEGPATIVTVLVDSGIKYLSKIYNADWLEQHITPNPDADSAD